MVEFYLLTFPRFPIRKKEHRSYLGKNRTHDFRTSRCAAYLLDHSGDEHCDRNKFQRGTSVERESFQVCVCFLLLFLRYAFYFLVLGGGGLVCALPNLVSVVSQPELYEHGHQILEVLEQLHGRIDDFHKHLSEKKMEDIERQRTTKMTPQPPPKKTKQKTTVGERD